MPQEKPDRRTVALKPTLATANVQLVAFHPLALLWPLRFTALLIANVNGEWIYLLLGERGALNQTVIARVIIGASPGTISWSGRANTTQSEVYSPFICSNVTRGLCS